MLVGITLDSVSYGYFAGGDFGHLEWLVVSAFSQLSLVSLGFCFTELVQHGLGDGQHHGSGSGVTDPHGEESCYTHEA